MGIWFNDTEVELPRTRLDSLRHPTPNGPERKAPGDQKLLSFDADSGPTLILTENNRKFHECLSNGGLAPFPGLLHFLAIIGTAGYRGAYLDDAFPHDGKKESETEQEIIDKRDWDTAEPKAEHTAVPSNPSMGSFYLYAQAAGPADKISAGDFSEFFPVAAPALAHRGRQAARSKRTTDFTTAGEDLLSTLPDDIIKHTMRFVFPVSSWLTLALVNKRFRHFVSDQLISEERTAQNADLITYSNELRTNSRRIILQSIQNAISRASTLPMVLSHLETELLMIAEKVNAYDDFDSILGSIETGAEIGAGRRNSLSLKPELFPEIQKLFKACQVDFIDAFIFNRTDFENYNIHQCLVFSVHLPAHGPTAQKARTLFFRAYFSCYGSRGEESDDFHLQFTVDDPSRLMLHHVFYEVQAAERLLRDNHFSVDIAAINAPASIPTRPVAAISEGRTHASVHNLVSGKEYREENAVLLFNTLKQHGFDLNVLKKEEHMPGMSRFRQQASFHPFILLLARIGLAQEPSYFCYITPW